MADPTNPCSTARQTFWNIIDLEANQKRLLDPSLDDSYSHYYAGGKCNIYSIETRRSVVAEEKSRLTHLFFSQINRAGPDCAMPPIPESWPISSKQYYH